VSLGLIECLEARDGSSQAADVKARSPAPTAKFVPNFSIAEADGSARLGFGGFFFAVLGRSGGFERAEKTGGDFGNFLDRGLEGGFVGFRGLGEAADFAHELERGGADFVVGYRRIEVKKRSDVSAHRSTPHRLKQG